jgi:2-polyprenyl-3-methyl-5-hydroxy-6-metoxy-1,4-benzoquinol methylase
MGLVQLRTVMTKTMSHNNPSVLNREFLEEYSTKDSLRRYSKETAGNGISYLLDHDYGEIYFSVIEEQIPKPRIKRGIRLWEFGCGAGMNLLHLVSALARRGVAVEHAVGTDFSEALIGEAKRQAQRYLAHEQNQKVRFCVARHENLIEEVAKGLGVRKETLLGSFDVMLGVNTIRYCHRLMKENEVAATITSLLADRGVCIVIDMNDKFPAFRSRFRDRLAKEARAYYLPSLEEYARPFSAAGLQILKRENFCWIPHSAGSGLTAVMRALTPVLNTIAPSRAMRSLVIAQKTGEPRP